MEKFSQWLKDKETINEDSKKDYYICDRDSYGQRSGTVSKISLSKNEITTDRSGAKFHKKTGTYLYDKEVDALRASQS